MSDSGDDFDIDSDLEEVRHPDLGAALRAALAPG